MPSQPDPRLLAQVVTAASAHGLESALVAAVVEQESGFEPLAMRYEPAYRYLYPTWETLRPPAGVSRETEIMQQRTSWGLMQVMGAVARELGYREKWISGLLFPEVGLEYGCRHLAAQLSRWGFPGGVSAYNAGHPTPANQIHYTDRVLARMEILRPLVEV